MLSPRRKFCRVSEEPKEQLPLWFGVIGDPDATYSPLEVEPDGIARQE